MTVVRGVVRAAVVLGATALLACGAESQSDEDCLYTTWTHRSPDRIPEAVDVLFVIDEAPGMAGAQVGLTAELGAFVARMIDTQEVDGLFVPEVGDLHVAVLSPDLGGGGFPGSGCGTGRGGVFTTTSDDAGCDEEYPGYLSYDRDDDPSVLVSGVGCVATMGEEGCRFRQPFEAVRRGLVEADDDGEHLNGDFLRPESILAVVFVTNGDDCSVRPESEDLFDPLRGEHGPLDVRCALAGEDVLQPVEAYAEELLALRPEEPERLVVAAIGGFPSPTECGTGGSAEELRCRLDEPGMQVVVDGERLAPSCAAERAEAVPPRRVVQLVEQVVEAGGGGVVQSICDADWSEGLSSLAAALRGRLEPPCAYGPRSGEVAACVFEWELAGDGPCAPGLLDRGLDRVGHRHCEPCAVLDGEVQLQDASGRAVPECAAMVEAGHSIEYGPHVLCPYGSAFVLRGDVFPAPGTVASLSCLVEWCAP